MNESRQALSWVEKGDHGSLEAWLKTEPKIDLMLLHRLWSTATKASVHPRMLIVLFRHTPFHEVWGNTIARHVAWSIVQDQPQVFAEVLKKINEDRHVSSLRPKSPQADFLRAAPPLEVVLNDVLVHLKNTDHADHHIRKWLSNPAFKMHDLPRTVSSILYLFVPLMLKHDAPLPQSSLHQAWVELTTSLTPLEMKNALRSLPSSPILPHIQDALLQDLFDACLKKDTAWWDEMERLDAQQPKPSLAPSDLEWLALKERRHLLQAVTPRLLPDLSPSVRKL